MQLNFHDEVFDNPTHWIHHYKDRRFDQRYLGEGDVIFCETTMKVRCSVEAAVSLLCSPWTWWEHGRSINFHSNDDRYTEQILAPVWWYWTRVGLRIFPPVELPGSGGHRIPLLLSRHYQGPASIDVFPNPGSSDAVLIRGRFHGVENHVPFVPLILAERVHLRAEAGTFFFPFPKGTGWCGLWRRLESRAPIFVGRRRGYSVLEPSVWVNRVLKAILLALLSPPVQTARDLGTSIFP
jgi:hypothetical protein